MDLTTLTDDQLSSAWRQLNDDLIMAQCADQAMTVKKVRNKMAAIVAEHGRRETFARMEAIAAKKAIMAENPNHMADLANAEKWLELSVFADGLDPKLSKEADWLNSRRALKGTPTWWEVQNFVLNLSRSFQVPA